ncbi:hypothetical protein [Radiobacillus sp. PE A8.2]|uniref:hypothetical protein n=1 Tax=Radiobacillus sp. PE A8.2 TaxID=3380349 RepID=UPI00388F03E4
MTVTISTSLINNADIAVGNGLDTIIFNIFVLFALDIYFRKKGVFLRVSDNHLYTGFIAIILSAITLIGLISNQQITLANVNIISFAIAIVYIVGLNLTSITQSNDESPQEQKDDNASTDIHLRSTMELDTYTNLYNFLPCKEKGDNLRDYLPFIYIIIRQ